MNDIRKTSSYDIEGKGLPSKVETLVLVAHVKPLKLVEAYIKEKGYDPMHFEKGIKIK